MVEGRAAQDDIIDEDDVAAFDVFDDLVVRSENRRWAFRRIKISQPHRHSMPNDRVDRDGSRRCLRPLGQPPTRADWVDRGWRGCRRRSHRVRPGVRRSATQAWISSTMRARAVLSSQSFAASTRRPSDVRSWRSVCQIVPSTSMCGDSVISRCKLWIAKMRYRGCIPPLVLTIVRISARKGVHQPLTGDPP